MVSMAQLFSDGTNPVPKFDPKIRDPRSIGLAKKTPKSTLEVLGFLIHEAEEFGPGVARVLFSQRHAAAELGMDRKTIREAIALLQKHRKIKLIKHKQNRGYLFEINAQRLGRGNRHPTSNQGGGIDTPPNTEQGRGNSHPTSYEEADKNSLGSVQDEVTQGGGIDTPPNTDRVGENPSTRRGKIPPPPSTVPDENKRESANACVHPRAHDGANKPKKRTRLKIPSDPKLIKQFVEDLLELDDNGRSLDTFLVAAREVRLDYKRAIGQDTGGGLSSAILEKYKKDPRGAALEYAESIEILAKHRAKKRRRPRPEKGDEDLKLELPPFDADHDGPGLSMHDWCALCHPLALKAIDAVIDAQGFEEYERFEAPFNAVIKRIERAALSNGGMTSARLEECRRERRRFLTELQRHRRYLREESKCSN